MWFTFFYMAVHSTVPGAMGIPAIGPVARPGEMLRHLAKIPGSPLPQDEATDAAQDGRLAHIYQKKSPSTGEEAEAKRFRGMRPAR